MEASGQLHAPAALSPGKETLLPIGYKPSVPKFIEDKNEGRMEERKQQ
jgi:hypothetical protein